MKKKIKVFIVSLFILLTTIIQAKDYKSIAWEDFKNSGPNLKQIGCLETKHSKDIEFSPWSVGCETLDRDYADFSIYKNYVGELGVKHARLQSGWAKCEKQKGVYNFAWLDTCVYGLSEQGVNPWISLSYGNPIYKSEKDLGAGIFTDEGTMTAWCNYVEATVSRYKGVVKEWEIWNEPRHSESPEAYANLLIRTSEVIRRVQPGATILGFTVHGFSPSVVLKFPKAVFEILKAKNKLDVVDYVTYHPYTPNPDECYPMVDGLKDLVQSYNPRLKLYQGESGCPSILEWGHAMNNYPWTEYSQAKWDMRRMAGDWARGIRSSVFTIIDLRYTSMLQSFGLIRANLLHEIIYKRPSYYGVQHMTSVFDDSVDPPRLLKYESNSPRSMTVAGFEKQISPVVMIWYDDLVPTDDLKWELTNLTFRGIKFKDPVYVEMITGKVYELENKSWRNMEAGVEFMNLPVWDSPVMIAERVMVKMKPVDETLHSSGKLKVMQCWDDSPTTDIPLITLLKKYDAKATFNIIPMKNRKMSVVKKKKTCEHVLFSFLSKDDSREGGFRWEHLASSEMPEIYKDFKVAAHCRIPLGGSLEEYQERMQILKQTKTMIRDDFGQEKCGFVYPGGNYSEEAMKDIEKAGYRYARTTKNADTPLPLDAPMLLPTSCHWASPKFWEKYEEAKKKGGVFYFWGHSVELGDDPELWTWLGSIYERISNDPDAEWVDVVDLF